MNRPHPIAILLLLAGLLAACEPPPETADGYGHFEATELTVSAEQAGPILWLDLEEGDRLTAGQLVGLVDTLPLHLQRLEIQARLEALEEQFQNPESRVEVLAERRRNLERELGRSRALLAGKAATQRQVDDLAGQIEVVDREIASLREQARLANRGIRAERRPLRARLDQVEEQLRRCRIVNPADGAVLLKLANAGEMASPGKPLYTLADLDTLELRAYVSGAQLSHLRIGDRVEVQFDRTETQNQSLPGRITWIAEKAEFTPATIQTKEERVSLVYALKVRVANDGRLKIGMPGEFHID